MPLTPVFVDSCPTTLYAAALTLSHIQFFWPCHYLHQKLGWEFLVPRCTNDKHALLRFCYVGCDACTRSQQRMSKVYHAPAEDTDAVDRWSNLEFMATYLLMNV